MIVKSKFKDGDVVYYKYPSRYSRSRDIKTVEAIIKIHKVTRTGNTLHASTIYIAEILKAIRGDLLMTLAFRQGGAGRFELDTIEIDTYSRHLTPAEKVLYGSNG